MKPKKLYHGTTKENLSNILIHGIKPHPNWDSGNLPVVSLTNFPEYALREAYVVDISKIQLCKKRNLAKDYVVLEVATKRYKVKKWQSGKWFGKIRGEWWILRTVLPKDIRVVLEKDYKSVKKEFK